MNIGDLVYNTYHGILRFGTVQSKRIDTTGWAYFKITWHDDNAYENAIAHREKLTNKKYKLEEYRADQLSLASKEYLSNVIKQHEKSNIPSRKLSVA